MADVFYATFESGIVDESPLGQTVTLEDDNATPVIDTTTVYAGAQSLEVPQYSGISVPVHASMNFTTAWHIDMAVYFDSLDAFNEYELAGQFDGGASVGTWKFAYYHDAPGDAGIYLYRDPDDTGFWNAVTPLFFPCTLTAATYVRLTLSFDGSEYTLLIDDTPEGSPVASATGLAVSTHKLSFGTILQNGIANSLFAGFLDNVRMSTSAYSASGGLDDTITDGVTMFDDVAPGELEVILETIGAGSALAVVRHITITQAVRLAHDQIVANGYLVAQSDTIAIAPTLDTLRGILLYEGLGLAQTQLLTTVLTIAATDTVGARDALLAGIPVGVTDGVGLALVHEAQAAVLMLEVLGLAETVAQSLIYGRSWSDGARLADALTRFFGQDLTDGIGLLETVGDVGSFRPVLTDGVGVAPALAHSLVLRITTADTVALDDADALAMLYAPTLVDGVEIAAGMISPSGSFTTWAMNARTAAVTEYHNYAFNSFAKLGSKYVGTSASGLYELSGDSDDGTDIVAQIKSGLTQFAGARQTQFKGIYLAARGGGDFVLKLVSPDGREWHYGVATRDMTTTRVNLGKGLKARYFAFELISTGQDFDLESLEFVPLASDRRVG